MKNPQEIIREAFEYADVTIDKAIAVTDGGSSVECELEIEPEDFLAFAEKDLSSQDIRALTNALSNAKRAIDAQVAKILKLLRIRSEAVKKGKLDFLNDIGIVAPRIIRKIRGQRDLLEHEFKIPTRSQVEDAIDVASLFLMASARTLYVLPETLLIANEDEESDPIFLFKKAVKVTTDWEKEGFEVSAFRVGDTRQSIAGASERQVTNDMPLYYDILRAYIAAETDRNVRAALDYLRPYLE
jgi:hypothetical protein